MTFEPEVVLEGLSESSCPLVTDHRVAVDSDSSDARHAVKIGSAISQTVLPRLVVTLHGLVLKNQRHRRHADAGQVKIMLKQACQCNAKTVTNLPFDPNCNGFSAKLIHGFNNDKTKPFVS